MTAPAGRWFWLVVGFYVICSAVTFRYGTDFQDEGLLYQHGVRIVSGEVPYRDFFMVQAPGTFYVHAALIKLFGVSMVIGRLFKQVQGLVVIIFTYCLVRRALDNRDAALVAMAIAAAWSGALHMRFHWYSMDAAMLVLLAVYCFVRFVQGDRLGWLALAGGAVGLSVLFKQNLGLFAWAAGVFLCVALPVLARHPKWATIVWRSALYTAAAAAPPVLFLVYYTANHGRLHDIWYSTVVAPQRSYQFDSPLEALIHPLRVFLLITRRDVWVYIGLTLLVAGISLLVVRVSRSVVARVFGLCLIAFVVVWDVETFARLLVFPLNFLVFAVTLALAVRDAVATAGSPRSACRLTLVIFGLANVYGGTIVGGGWARLAEMQTATFFVYGALVDLLERNDAIQQWWRRWIAWSTPSVAVAATVTAMVWGVLMLVDNRGFRPWIDFPLYRLDRTMRVEGARGIVGFGPFVEDTEAVVGTVRGILDRRAMPREIFVFPLNTMLYPLIGARNSTTFDTLQSNPFVREMIPDLLQQLERRPPSVIVMHKRANPTLGPPLESATVWVVPESVFAMRTFLEHHPYRMAWESTFYEVWERT